MRGDIESLLYLFFNNMKDSVEKKEDRVERLTKLGSRFSRDILKTGVRRYLLDELHNPVKRAKGERVADGTITRLNFFDRPFQKVYEVRFQPENRIDVDATKLLGLA